MFHVLGELDGEHVVFDIQGSLPLAAKHLKLLTPTFQATKEGGLKAKLSWPLVVQLAGQLDTRWTPGPKLVEWMRAEVARRSLLPPLLAVTSPGAPAPREYQKEGAQLIAATGKTLIFDEAGAGKTLTAILGLLELQARHKLERGPIVVVCPNSVVDAWVDAVSRWSDLSVIAWRGEAKIRRTLVGTADVYVVGLGLIARDAHAAEGGPLSDLKPVAVVADEIHLLKNPQSLRSKAVRKLAVQAQAFIGLSGTPITHHMGDLWPTLQAMEPAAWPSRERFVARYLLTAATNYGEEVIGVNRSLEPEFRRCLVGQHRRLSKADVLPQLPPKVYSTRVVDLPAPARRAYESMKKSMLAELPDGVELPAMTVLAQLLRLLQLSCASADVVTSVVDEKLSVSVVLKEPSWKIDELVEVLAERPDQQALVFAPSAQLIRLAACRLEREGYRVGLVVGRQSASERSGVIQDFQGGLLDVVCATTGAGGVGITLTAASTVVFLQRPWSFVEAGQAEDRAHRLGSERHSSIEIVDIVARDTIDEYVREVLRGKAGALADLLQDKRIVEQCLGGVV